MNYKIVIDAGHGGDDLGNVGNGLIEKDFSLLVSNYIKDRLDKLGINNILVRNTDRDISDDERVSIIESIYGNESNVIVVSNHLNKGGMEGLEVIYALRNNDKLAKEIASQVSKNGVVNKYYQLRDSVDTSKDSFPIIRNTPNYESIVIEYGYVDNAIDSNRLKNDYRLYAEAVVRAIASYVGAKYIPIDDSNYYVVKKGDSLWKIANTYGVSVDELKKVNNLTSNNLNIGELLLIPGADLEDSTTYIVKSGDSLWKIANTYGVSVSDLKEINNLSSDFLSIGQKILIPGADLEDSITYIVKSGDSLWKIANTYGVSVSDLKKFNNLSSDFLSIGQKILIPGADLEDLTTYIVKSGDSLWKIANTYGVSVSDLKRVNNLSSDFLSIGQKILIPK